MNECEHAASTFLRVYRGVTSARDAVLGLGYYVLDIKWHINSSIWVYLTSRITNRCDHVTVEIIKYVIELSIFVIAV